jgi:hypothetical protein
MQVRYGTACRGKGEEDREGKMARVTMEEDTN